MTANDKTIGVRQDLPGQESAYIREAEIIEAINGPFGEVMLDAVGLKSGEAVLDVGCGIGTTTLEAGRRVAPTSAMGVDVDASLLHVAREQAEIGKVHNVRFVEADAQVYPFETASFDAVISRFGTMFFDDPEAAFANLGRAVRVGGRLAIVCPIRSEWVEVAMAAAAPNVGLPDLGSPGGPGPFAFADGSRLKRVIRAGGFHEVILEEITKRVRIGDDVEDGADFVVSLPEAQLLFEGKPDEKVAAAVRALREGLAPFSSPGGLVVSESAWLATALR
jgi:SAM-dependent methyltransferase